MDDAQQRERKLRLAESAAASAVLNGCDPDEVRRRMETGIAESVARNARLSRGQQAGAPLVLATRPSTPGPGTRALDEWASTVEAS